MIYLLFKYEYIKIKNIWIQLHSIVQYNELYHIIGSITIIYIIYLHI